MINKLNNKTYTFIFITFAYWFFMLSDGALRMIVLLHFHSIGFSPLQLAYLFLLYEFFGMITNLTAGWIAKKIGLNVTLYFGLILQIISLITLTQIDKSWSVSTTVIVVMFIQGISGIAKDLTKMSAKSSVKLLAPQKKQMLFKWVALLTGSKNAVKGLGFLLGALLLTFFNFHFSLIIMSVILTIILILTFFFLPNNLLTVNKKIKFIEIFSNNSNVNYLSLGRVFLFGARDVWLVIGLPVFFYNILSNGIQDDNHKAFFIIGSFMAIWTIFYGFIQSITPKILSETRALYSQAKVWANILIIIPLILIILNINFNESKLIITIVLLFVFGFVFAINSSIHSFLILKFTDKNRVTLDVGFYYMSNAFGRLIGTLLSGLSFEYGGFSLCLILTTILLFFNRLSLKKLN